LRVSKEMEVGVGANLRSTSRMCWWERRTRRMGVGRNMRTVVGYRTCCGSARGVKDRVMGGSEERMRKM